MRLNAFKNKEDLSEGQIKKEGVNNISRYECDENSSASDMLAKLANSLDVTADYLMDGPINGKAQIMISEKELLSQFQRVEKLPSEKKVVVK